MLVPSVRMFFLWFSVTLFHVCMHFAPRREAYAASGKEGTQHKTPGSPKDRRHGAQGTGQGCATTNAGAHKNKYGTRAHKKNGLPCRRASRRQEDTNANPSPGIRNQMKKNKIKKNDTTHRAGHRAQAHKHRSTERGTRHPAQSKQAPSEGQDRWYPGEA